jgi:hypothetical protein
MLGAPGRGSSNDKHKTTAEVVGGNLLQHEVDALGPEICSKHAIDFTLVGTRHFQRLTEQLGRGSVAEMKPCFRSAIREDF